MMAKPSLAEQQKFDYLTEILAAPVYDVAKETPLHLATSLSHRYSVQEIGKENDDTERDNNQTKIFLKREDLQPVHSFKIRGAYNRIRALSPEQKANGVVAVSSGNHAQGVALSAQKLGISATIVMPLATPAIKWKNVQRLGARVILKGNEYVEALIEGRRLVQEEGLTDIHPYDDPYVIAGQGTVGSEVLRQISTQDNLSAVFCCIGGGGLASGVASYIKRVRPDIKVFGVETSDSNAMAEALRAGQPTFLPSVGLFAEGAAARVVGKHTFSICSQLLDGVIMVDTDDICAAIKDIFEDTRSIVEPSGALSLAGLKKWLKFTNSNTNFQDGVPQTPIELSPGQIIPPFNFYPKEKVILSSTFKPEFNSKPASYVAILSGANMNFDRLRFVADRADIGLNKEALISISVPEQPGSFVQLHNLILPRSVTSFFYRYKSPKQGEILLSFSLLNPNQRDNELNELFSKLKTCDKFTNLTDLSDNELAKSHARFLALGQSNVPNERLFRFEFPERPDGLKNFLEGLNISWNVSLFQYRNYGGDTGKVLAGIQVPPQDYPKLDQFLNQLNYPWVEETENPVYTTFLKC